MCRDTVRLVSAERTDWSHGNNFITAWVGMFTTLCGRWYGSVVRGSQGRVVAVPGTTKLTSDAVAQRVAAVEREVVRALTSVTRTKLVKLIYLIDERYYRLYGETLTGLSYRFDKFGPNACDNAIVKVGDSLLGFELSVAREELGDGIRYTYRSGPSPRSDSVLSAQELGVIEDVLAEYGHLSREQVVAASKATRPFWDGPKPGDLLQMASVREDAEERLGEIRILVAAVPEIPDFEPTVE